MRTSPTQFDMLVTFMEQHGDITKPLAHAKGKLHTLQLWEELTTLLNSDGSGEKKSVDKWKKVWSDMKNNTKKKAARIHRAATGTGGGPAITSKLNELELRIIHLVGTQAATGLVAITESGFSQEMPNLQPVPPPTPTDLYLEAPSSPVQTLEIIETYEDWNQPGPSSQSHIASPASPPHLPIPNQQGSTPTRRPRVGRIRKSPRRRPTMTNVDRVSEDFLHSDAEWRKFFADKAKRDDDNEKERLRQRNLELQLQEQWQKIVSKALEILEKKKN